MPTQLVFHSSLVIKMSLHTQYSLRLLLNSSSVSTTNIGFRRTDLSHKLQDLLWTSPIMVILQILYSREHSIVRHENELRILSITAMGLHHRSTYPHYCNDQICKNQALLMLAVQGFCPASDQAFRIRIPLVSINQPLWILNPIVALHHSSDAWCPKSKVDYFESCGLTWLKSTRYWVFSNSEHVVFVFVLIYFLFMLCNPKFQNLTCPHPVLLCSTLRVVMLLSLFLGFLALLTALWLGTIQRTHSLCHSPYSHLTVL